MTSRPSTAAPILATLAVVLVTLGAYVGGYLALIERGGVDFESVISDDTWNHAPKYRCGGVVSKAMFAPAHAVDRSLRPKHWEIR